MKTTVIYNSCITIESNKDQTKWSCCVKIMGQKGTHDNYNVIYNSQCNNIYFDTYEEALKIGEWELNKHFNKN